MTTPTIRTPKGKRLSFKQYVALTEARQSSRNGADVCEHGHFECAAWHHGPCSDEIRANIEEGE